MRSLVVALHDVAPAHLDETRRWRERIATLAEGPVSLLVVPRYHGGPAGRPGPTLSWLGERAEAGDEVVMHGYAHLTARGGDRGELRGRPRSDVWARVSEGREELRCAGLDARGFIAPAYAHPRAADVACAAAGLRWWATRLTLRAPAGQRSLPSVSLGGLDGAPAAPLADRRAGRRAGAGLGSGPAPGPAPGGPAPRAAGRRRARAHRDPARPGPAARDPRVPGRLTLHSSASMLRSRGPLAARGGAGCFQAVKRSYQRAKPPRFCEVPGGTLTHRLREAAAHE